MCLSPLHIANRTRSFDPTTNKRFLTVPCGKCKSCRSKQQDDWYIRAFFEYKRVKSVGGATWFVTLTYNDTFLPIWHDKGFNFPCFCYTHIKTFRNKLRIYLHRHFFYSFLESWKVKNIENYVPIKNIVFKDDAALIAYRKKYRVPKEIRKEYRQRSLKLIDDFRFVICSEFGGEKGRPHYHGLLFCPFFIKFSEFNDILRKAWIYGFVSWSHDRSAKSPLRYKPIVESSRGIKYVMKYISKDDTWSDTYCLHEYKDYLKWVHRKDKNPDALHQKLLAFKRSSPRHYQSMFFGFDGLCMFRKNGVYDANTVASDKVSLISFGASPDAKGNEYPFRIPSYYLKKMCYDYDKENHISVLNDFGKEVLILKFNKRFCFTCQYLNDWLQSKDVFISKSFGVDIFRFCSKKSIINCFTSKSEIYDYLIKLLNGRPIELLAIYNCLYRGLLPEMFDYVNNLSLSEQIDYVLYPQNVACVLTLSVNSFDKNLLYEEGDSEFLLDRKFTWRHNTYGTLQCFAEFDDILDMLSEIEYAIGRSQHLAHLSTSMQKQKTLSTISKMMYGHV